MKKNKIQNNTLFFGIFGIIFLILMGGAFAATSPAQSEYYYLVDLSEPSFLPSIIYPGDTVSMALDITNRGGTYSISNLSTNVSLADQLEFISSDSNVPLILRQETKKIIITFKVKDNALPGYYPLQLEIVYTRDGRPIYNDEDIIKETFTIYVPITKAQRNLDILVTPNIINPSSLTELKFTLSNVGGNSVSNISFDWKENNNLILPIGSDNKRFINSINSGNSTIVNYIVAADPNITTGIYPININVTFTDTTGSKTQTSTIGLIVGGNTDFEVSADLTKDSISINLANIGTNNAESVVVKIFGDELQLNNNTEIIGNLNRGDYTIASFDLISINNNKINLEIDYTDTTGKRQTITKSLMLGNNNQIGFDLKTGKVLNKQNNLREENQQGFPIIPIIILVIVGVIVIIGYKKRDVIIKKFKK